MRHAYNLESAASNVTCEHKIDNFLIQCDGEGPRGQREVTGSPRESGCSDAPEHGYCGLVLPEQCDPSGRVADNAAFFHRPKTLSLRFA